MIFAHTLNNECSVRPNYVLLFFKDSSTTESVRKSKGYMIDATPLELLTKSIKNHLSSSDVVSATPMILTNETASTPLTYNRANVLLARDSDPGCIVQSMDNHFGLTIRSSTCLSAEESVFTIEESDLVTSNAAKRYFLNFFFRLVSVCYSELFRAIFCSKQSTKYT